MGVPPLVEHVLGELSSNLLRDIPCAFQLFKCALCSTFDLIPKTLLLSTTIVVVSLEHGGLLHNGL